MEIFKLFGSVFIDNEKANESISKTEEKGKSLGSTMLNGVKTAAKWGAAILAAGTAAVGGMVAAMNKTAEYADEIDKLSERTGINREELQKWKYAAGQSGADIGKLEVGMKKLSEVMNGATTGNKNATDAFKKLGISVKDVKNLTQEQIFDKVMTGLANMEQGAARNALGNQLLGKSYTELMPLLNAGAGGMEELKKRADELGIVMSEDAIKAGVVYGDTMDDIKQSFGGVIRTLTMQFLPTLQKMMDWTVAHMPEIQATIGSVFGFITSAISFVSEEVIPRVVKAYEWLKENFDIIGPAVAAMLLVVLVPAFIAWAAAAGTAAAATIAALAPVLIPIALVGAAVVGLALVWRKWGDDIKMFVADAINYAKGKLNDFIGFVNGIIDKLNKIPSVNIGTIGKVPVGSPQTGFGGLSNIPGLAGGGTTTSPGWTLVGEQGPELLNLNAGAQVRPLDNQSPADNKRMAAEIAAAVYDAIADALKGQGGSKEAVLEIDGIPFARVLIPLLDSERQRLGVDPV